LPRLRGKTFRSKAAALLVCAAAAAVLTGCPKVPKVVTKTIPVGPKPSNLEVRVQMDEKANGEHPVALDLLLVSDKELLEKLEEMSASEWFKRRAQIMLDNPDGKALVVTGWELVPGQVTEMHVVRVEPEVRAAIVFADYANDGEHRAVVKKPRRGIVLKLGANKFEVTQMKK
jgi:type VI secretion system protein